MTEITGRHLQAEKMHYGTLVDWQLYLLLMLS